jgi:hypothetical protein
VNGKQITLFWLVDDMKVSHCDSKRADGMIKWLRMKLEHPLEDGIGAVKTFRGKVHECCIRMTLDFAAPGRAK